MNRSTNRRNLRYVLTAFCSLLLVMPTSLLAQVSTADIVGTATDPNGAAVASGTATATNLATGVTQKVALSNTGDFTFTLLQIGTYSVDCPGARLQGIRYAGDACGR